jgi:2-polyprenyl-3-methyl-5-hydroxy-6-metoxy-1,4-benzoquinol methylase
MKYYTEKKEDYFSHARRELISFIPKNPSNKILEIGAGGGDTLLEIKKLGLAKEVVGIELMELPGTKQNDRSIDQWIFADIEKYEFPFENETFDVIIAGDVFEHLVDPWKALRKITPLLKKGGLLITSIPNIRIKNAMFKIYFRGDFGYTAEGTFDKTHLRFFCKKNMIDMLSTEELQITEVKRDFDFKKNSRPQIINALTFNLFEEFLALQFLFSVKRVK